MSITFPRDLPSLRISGCYFELEPRESFAPEQGGRFVSTELGGGPAPWIMRIETTPPTELEFSKWRAWFSSLKGSGKEFFGHDVRRRMPYAYRNGFADHPRAVSGTAFDGTTTSWDVDDERTTISLGAASGQQLPVSMTLTVGDYIGLKWDTWHRSLHRVLETANANTSGAGQWLVEPFVHPLVPENATVNLIAADCVMIIKKRDGPDASIKSRRLSFEAEQHLE